MPSNQNDNDTFHPISSSSSSSSSFFYSVKRGQGSQPGRSRNGPAMDKLGAYYSTVPNPSSHLGGMHVEEEEEDERDDLRSWAEVVGVRKEGRYEVYVTSRRDVVWFV